MQSLQEQMQALLNPKADTSLYDLSENQLAVKLVEAVKAMDETSADMQDMNLPLLTRVNRSLDADEKCTSVIQALFSEREQVLLLCVLESLHSDSLAPDDQTHDEFMSEIRHGLFW
jgi:hypothetical protein|tara:strand:- start:183 stop:530 length:348 start_codon:yes stop_codon:yes gene_type:complete